MTLFFKLYYECLFFSLPVTAVTFSAAALWLIWSRAAEETNSDIKLMSFKSLWINIRLILEMMVPLFLSGTSTLIFLFFPHMYVTHARTVMWHVKNFIKIPFHMWAGDDIMNVQRWWQSCYGYTSSLLCKDNMDGRGLGTAACSSVYKLSGLIGSRCCCTVWTVQSALAPRGLVAETRSGYRSRVVMMSCNATGGLWRGCCSNDEPYQWIMGVLGVKGPQTLHTVASVVHTHKLVAGGVWVSRGGSLWQHVSIYGLCQAWWAVLCWECWQIPWMFSGFCVCKTWIKDTDSELNEVLTIFLYRGLSCWTKSSRLCSLNCTSTKTSSVVVSLLGWLAGWHAPA